MSSFKENLQNQREKFKKVFNDTINCYMKEERLVNDLFYSINNQKVYKDFNYIINQTITTGFPLQNVNVTQHRTFEAAKLLHEKNPKDKIAVLNFASATNPGGGVFEGSSAQEECLCRASYLYQCLIAPSNIEQFYSKNRQLKNPLHNDWIIYTPKVTVFKTDDKEYNKLKENEYYQVDVITCAAPNLREKLNNNYNQENAQPVTVSDDELYILHFNRADAILQTALKNNVNILVLGAFGCGAFKNKPEIVAKAYYTVLHHYADKFKHIEFAIYCNSYNDANIKAFNKQFN